MLSTTYQGHKIEIEPFEWGYVARVLVPGSERPFVAANSSAFEALEQAFGMVDGALRPAEEAAD